MLCETCRNIVQRFAEIQPNLKDLPRFQPFNAKFCPHECHWTKQARYVQKLISGLFHSKSFLFSLTKTLLRVPWIRLISQDEFLIRSIDR